MVKCCAHLMRMYLLPPLGCRICFGQHFFEWTTLKVLKWSGHVCIHSIPSCSKFLSIFPCHCCLLGFMPLIITDDTDDKDEFKWNKYPGSNQVFHSFWRTKKFKLGLMKLSQVSWSKSQPTSTDSLFCIHLENSCMLSKRLWLVSFPASITSLVDHLHSSYF